MMSQSDINLTRFNVAYAKSELGAIATSQGKPFKRNGVSLQYFVSCAFGWSLSLPVLICPTSPKVELGQ